MAALGSEATVGNFSNDEHGPHAGAWLRDASTRRDNASTARDDAGDDDLNIRVRPGLLLARCPEPCREGRAPEYNAF